MPRVILLLSGRKNFQGRISSFQECANIWLVEFLGIPFQKNISHLWYSKTNLPRNKNNNFKFILPENQKFAVNMRMDSVRNKMKQ